MTQFVDPLPPTGERVLRNLGPALMLITLLFVWVQLARPFAWTPLSYVNPQQALESTVAAGSAIHIRGTKCNDTDQAVSVTGKTYLVRLEPRTPALVFDGSAARVPGCMTATWANMIPTGTPPGTYRFEGIEVAEDGERMHRGAWYTESFEVIAP